MTADPRLWRSFVVLAEELHFGRAAERLHLTQPALSHQVRRLERQLGVTLFARTRRSVELTEAGEAVLGPARASLAAAEAAYATARAHATGQRGLVRLGYSPGAHHAAQVTLRALAGEGGDLRVRAREEPSASLAEHVAAGDLDVAIGFCTEAAEGVEREPLLDEAAVLAVRRGHPLAGSAPVDLAALAAHTIALVDERDGPGYNRAVLAMCRAAGFEPRVRGSRGGPTAWETAVAEGATGITTRSATHAHAPGIVVVALRDPPRFSLELLRPRDGEAAPAVSRLCDTARRLAAAGRLVRAT